MRQDNQAATRRTRSPSPPPPSSYQNQITILEDLVRQKSAIFRQICIGPRQRFATAAAICGADLCNEAICQFVTKFVWNLGRFLQPEPFVTMPDHGHLPIYHQICIGSGQIFTAAAICYCATKIVQSLSRSPRPRPSASLSPNFVSDLGRFRGHLPVYYQICMGPRQISALAAICHQICIESGEIFTTAAICQATT